MIGEIDGQYKPLPCDYIILCKTPFDYRVKELVVQKVISFPCQRSRFTIIFERRVYYNELYGCNK